MLAVADCAGKGVERSIGQNKSARRDSCERNIILYDFTRTEI